MFDRFGIAAKLVLAFGGIFALAIVIAAAGWFGFESISSSQRSVIGNAIPTLRVAQRLAEVNAGIVASSRQLARSENDIERAWINDYLDQSASRLLSLVEQLEIGGAKQRTFDQLREVVQTIRNNLVDQSELVGRKLQLGSTTATVFGEVLEAADQLTELSESLVANAASGATATSVGLYDLVEVQASTEEAFIALDRLVEVDLDGMERMFELRLRSARVASFIAQLNREVRVAQIGELQRALQVNLAVLERRLNDVNDPGRKAQATQLFESISTQTASENPQSLFNLRINALETDQAIDTLVSANAVLAEQLTDEISRIVDASGRTIDETTAFAEQSLASSRRWFLIVALVTGTAVLVFFWWYLQTQVIRRLAALRRSTLEIADGDLSSSPIVQGTDELADMGTALEVFRDNALTRQQLESELVQYHQQLEQLVAQRTAELEQANEDLSESVKQHAHARERAELANRAKTTFLATMSHELRTPVSGMLGTSRLLEQTGLNDDQTDLVRALRSAGGSLLNIVNDVLDLSKFEGGRPRLEYRAFDVHSMVLDLIALMRSPAEDRGLSLDYVIDPDIDRVLVGDEERLRQVLTNLLGNAIKFTDKGGIFLELEKMSAPGAAVCTIRFRVEDSGVGIAEDMQDAIFEPFTQADASVARRHGGSGLGLAICRLIVDAMAGDIRVASTPGEGTSFELDLRFAVGEKESSQRGPALGPVVTLSRQVVLVVEDDSVNRMVTRRFLEALQHEVVEAASGFEALRLFDERRDINVVLMDIGLPGMDGLETARHLRRRFDDGRASVPIVAMSAHVFREEIDDYLEAGMDGYLAKPFETAQLDEVLKSAVSSAHKPVAAVSGPRASNEILNVQVLQTDARAIGDRAVADIIDLFLDSQPGIEASISQAIETGDKIEATHLFHRLRSSSGNLGLDRLSSTAAGLEKSLRAGVDPGQALHDFFVLLQQSVIELRTFRQGLDRP